MHEGTTEAQDDGTTDVRVYLSYLFPLFFVFLYVKTQERSKLLLYFMYFLYFIYPTTLVASL